MSKDSYWFRHDSTAGRGTRIRKMAFIYNHWGKGVYWDVIEILRDQDNYRFPCTEFDLKMLSDLIGCKDENKFINWFNDCVNFDLFKVESGEFFSEVLCENMKRWESSKSNGSKGGRPPRKKPKKNPTNNLTNNLDKTIIEENRIEEKKKENSNKELIGQVKPSHLPHFILWLEYRKDIKKPIKVVKTLEALVKKFNKHSVDCCQWVVNHSIENNYQGLFWDKYTENKKVNKPIITL